MTEPARVRALRPVESSQLANLLGHLLGQCREIFYGGRRAGHRAVEADAEQRPLTATRGAVPQEEEEEEGGMFVP